jgi:hypothetical protein
MEATRPTPVDLNQLSVGEKRLDVVEALGSPTATLPSGQQQCDIYKLYTRGPGGVGKGVAAAGEAVGDVLTLGLAEVIWTPVEAGTRNQLHTVTVCYDENNQVAAIRES